MHLRAAWYGWQDTETQQKYSLDIQPRGEGKYMVEVQSWWPSEGTTAGSPSTWEPIYTKQNENSYQPLNIHKLATRSSIHAFCLTNLGEAPLKLGINFQSGLELMEFELLPDKSDSENLKRELDWLGQQKNKLFETLSKMEELKSNSSALANLLSTKMIGFAIIGIAVILIVNLLFYRELKRTLKDRKLI